MNALINIKIMETLFLTLLIVTPIGLILGLINPRIFSRIIKNATRKKLSLIFGLVFVVSFIGYGITASPVEPKTPEELIEVALTDEEKAQKKENKAKEETKLQDSQVEATEVEAPTKPDNLEQVTIARVIDGDTVVTLKGERIRYIGIDTPETVHPYKDIEFYGQEASNKNKALVEGKTVELEKDISKTDRYGRTLAYIWLNDEMINATLVREGYAYAYTYPPDVKYSDYFLMLQKQAQDKKKGLWVDYK